jgi:hypothetical protein
VVTESKSSPYTVKVPQVPTLAPTEPEKTVLLLEFFTANVAPASEPLAIKYALFVAEVLYPTWLTRMNALDEPFAAWAVLTTVDVKNAASRIRLSGRQKVGCVERTCITPPE